MALNLKHELEQLVDALIAASVPFAICGGIAVTIHGAPRFTKDIDLLVPATAVAEAKQVAHSCGFTLAAGPMVFGHHTPTRRTVHSVSKPDFNDLPPLDLIVADGFLQEVWDSRQAAEWESRRVPIVSRSGLIQMKKAAGRKQDLLDIEKLSGDADGNEES